MQRSPAALAAGAVLLVALSAGLFWLVVSGKTRRTVSAPTPIIPVVQATSTPSLVPRRLDGVMVAPGLEALGTRAVMVENYIDARPLSGVSKANVAIESPVEGGITRFVLLFDASTTVAEVGPVRSARPYFVDWAMGWDAAYFHVGGSPDALQKLMAAPTSTFANIDEMRSGQFFWRTQARVAPHSTYTRSDLMAQAVADRGYTSSTAVISWHFQDAATSTDRGQVDAIAIPYGGNYNVSWKYDENRGVYVRSQAGKAQTDKDGSPVESENVIVIKTDSQVLDSYGRLQLRTTGSGDATAYRDGNKYQIRWHRTAGEPIRFSGNDGAEYLPTRGRTWIEVTTDDKTFAGLAS